MDISFSNFISKQKQNRTYKMREPIGDEAYRPFSIIAFRNEKDRYKADASVVMYVKVNQVTESGVTVGEEEMWYDFYMDIIGNNLDKLNSFIAKKEKGKSENLEKGIIEKEVKIKQPKRKAENSQFTPICHVPLPNNPKKCIVFYVKNKALGETQVEQEELMNKVIDFMKGQHYKILCREVAERFK